MSPNAKLTDDEERVEDRCIETCGSPRSSSFGPANGSAKSFCVFPLLPILFDQSVSDVNQEQGRLFGCDDEEASKKPHNHAENNRQGTLATDSYHHVKASENQNPDNREHGKNGDHATQSGVACP